MTAPGPAPHLHGFTVEWDPLNQEWLAISDSGRFRLRGRSEPDLYAARWRLWSQVLDDCRSTIAELFPCRST
jgi:hypothetical protein